MSTKIESNRLFTVHFGENKNLSITQIEAKNATEAIEQAKKDIDTSLDCTAVESNAIYASTLGIECDDRPANEENAVFEVIVRGTCAVTVEKMRDAIARAIGGIAVESSDLFPNGVTDDGLSLLEVITENGMSVVDL